MKKKKTIHLRKKRQTSVNKYRKYFAKKFPSFYNLFVYKWRKDKKKLLYSLLLFFHCMGAFKILNYIKQLGLTKDHKILIYKKKSLKSLKLIKKFKKKVHIYKLSKKVSKILKVLFIKKFLFFSNIHRVRYNNIKKKQEMCLYFSYRHILFLPVRGQRTKTNAKTRKDFNIF